MQSSDSQWAAAHGGGESWQWGHLGAPTGGGGSVDAGSAAAAVFDAQYNAAPQGLGGQPSSTQSNPAMAPFGAQPPGAQATLGDMNVMYDLLGQGALPQSQFDMLMGGGQGQEGLATVAGSMGNGYPPGAGAGRVQMRNPMQSYSAAPSAPGGYPPLDGAAFAAFASAPSSFDYRTPSVAQPPMHHQQMPNSLYSQSSWLAHPSHHQPHLPQQPAPPKPLPPHPAFQAYPSPPISTQLPLPGRSIPPPMLASHVANLDRVNSLQNQIREREAILGAGVRGRDPAIMAQLQSQLHLLKAQQGPLMTQCQAFIHVNGGHELVGAEVHAYKMQQGGGGPLTRPSSRSEPRLPPPYGAAHLSVPPPPSATLPFPLPQSANARAFNNLPVSNASVGSSPAPTFQPSYPSPAAQHQPPTLQPGAQTHTPPPPSSPAQPRPHPQPPQVFPQQPQQPQQPPRPRPLPVQRSSTDLLPPGLRAQMAAARRAQSNQPPPSPASPSVAMGNLSPNTPIMPTPGAPALGGRAAADGSPGSRPVAPLSKGRDARSATTILAERSPGMPTLAQLHNQLTKEKFNSTLPNVLAKQSIPFAANYTVGQGAFPVDLFRLYQTVMVIGHGGEQVTSESRWPSIAASLSLPSSDRDTVPQELGDLYMRILMPFEIVWSTALLAQRTEMKMRAEQSRQKALDEAMGPAEGGTPSLFNSSSSTVALGASGFTLPTPGGSDGSAPPPRFHPSQFEIPRADPNDPKSAFRFGGVDFTLDPNAADTIDMATTSLNDIRQHQEKERRAAAEAHEKIRASARAGGQLAPFTPPSPPAWAEATAPGSAGAGPNLPRRSTAPARAISGRFEELLDVGGAEDLGERRRKRTKSGEATMGGEFTSTLATSATAVDFTLPTFPANTSNATFAESTSAPPALPPLPPSLSLPTNDDLFPPYLFNDPTGGSPPSSLTTKTPDLLFTGVGAADEDTPSSSIDLSGLGMGMGLGEWDTGLSSGDLGGGLSKWDAGTGLSEAAFNFEEELASWTAAGPGGGM